MDSKDLALHPSVFVRYLDLENQRRRHDDVKLCSERTKKDRGRETKGKSHDNGGATLTPSNPRALRYHKGRKNRDAIVNVRK
jgi:hypothetical protein